MLKWTHYKNGISCGAAVGTVSTSEVADRDWNAPCVGCNNPIIGSCVVIEKISGIYCKSCFGTVGFPMDSLMWTISEKALRDLRKSLVNPPYWDKLKVV